MGSILVTGSSGLVGTHLVKKLIEKGYEVVGADIMESDNLIDIPNFRFVETDLSDINQVKDLFLVNNFDGVLNTFGIKGSPIKAKTRPVDFLYPSFLANTEIINQCSSRDIWLVFVSSVGVYAPSEKFVEDTVWSTLPSEADWFPSWSKRAGELLLEAYKIQYGFDKWSIIRPANIFGEYDDFSGNGTVIASTIKKIYQSDGSITVWGDGSPIRDFVYAGDVADAIIDLYERQLKVTVNFGSGEEISIKRMVEELVEVSGKKDTIINWDSSKPNGDLRRQMDITKQSEINLLPKLGFKEALRLTYNSYMSEFDRDEFFRTGVFIGDSKILFKNQRVFNENAEKVRRVDINKESYKYRQQITNSNFEYLPHTVNIDEIEDRQKLIDENGLHVFQQWYESNPAYPEFGELYRYFVNKVKKFVVNIYPELQDNIHVAYQFSIYENGDFLDLHNDSKVAGRKCGIIQYLSEKDDYPEDGGGVFYTQTDENPVSVYPFKENFVMLDFTKNEPLHGVTMVKNGFRRFAFLCFVFDEKVHLERQRIIEEEKKEKEREIYNLTEQMKAKLMPKRGII